MPFFWAYGCIWILETLTALGQFVISHAVVVREVNESHSWFPLIHGYFNCLVFHVGTIAFGGFVLGTLRLINLIVSLVMKQLKHKDKDGKDKNSCIVEVCCCCCLCCMSCLIKTAELINDLVYTECALNGKGYVDSVYNVLKLVTKPTNVQAYAIMESATSFLKALGILSITCVTSWICFKYLTMFMDPRPEPQGVIAITTATFLISFFIAMAFMSTFSQAALTMMYVQLWEKEEKEDEERGNKDDGYNKLEDDADANGDDNADEPQEQQLS